MAMTSETLEVIAEPSAYSKALAALRAKEFHELKEVGDQWRTPDLLFWGVNALYGPLVLDLFADDHNAKCPAWYTAEDNALTQNWSQRLSELNGAGYGNPPYSRAQYHEKQAVTGMRHIMAHAHAMRDLGGRYVFLIKAATGEVWWPEDADHIAFIRGRISFDLPDWYRPAEGQPSESSAGFGAAIAVFDKSWNGPRFDYINRGDLEAKGQAFMSLAQFAAAKVVPPAPMVEVTSAVVDLPEVESRIWPLEVGLVFNQIEGVDSLALAQQNKLKANINQLWLERMPTSEIINVAGGLVNSMQGAANA